MFYTVIPVASFSKSKVMIELKNAIGLKRALREGNFILSSASALS